MNEENEYRFEELLLRKLDKIIEEIKTMSQSLDNLVTVVAQTDGVINSAIALLNGITAQIAEIQAELAAAGIDNAKLDELSTDLTAKASALAQAVANVPPPPPPPPG